MFRGIHEHTIDAKGRVSVPARFRDLIASHAECSDSDVQLIVTKGMDRCLVAYPMALWRAFEEKVAALPRFDPAVVKLKRLVVASAAECFIDKNGRMLIPPVLRQYADVGKDVVWAGMTDTIEIWAKEHWDVQTATTPAEKAAIAQTLTELGL